MRLLATTCIAALALMLAGRDLAALTIVRIGGQGLPVPERAGDEGVNFVQLTWEEATGGDFGSTRLITFDGGSISPVFASKDHNLTPGHPRQRRQHSQLDRDRAPAERRAARQPVRRRSGDGVLRSHRDGRRGCPRRTVCLQHVRSRLRLLARLQAPGLRSGCSLQRRSHSLSHASRPRARSLHTGVDCGHIDRQPQKTW